MSIINDILEQEHREIDVETIQQYKQLEIEYMCKQELTIDDIDDIDEIDNVIVNEDNDVDGDGDGLPF
jgi:hypothetical protein